MQHPEESESVEAVEIPANLEKSSPAQESRTMPLPGSDVALPPNGAKANGDGSASATAAPLPGAATAGPAAGPPQVALDSFGAPPPKSEGARGLDRFVSNRQIAYRRIFPRYYDAKGAWLWPWQGLVSLDPDVYRLPPVTRELHHGVLDVSFEVEVLFQASLKYVQNRYRNTVPPVDGKAVNAGIQELLSSIVQAPIIEAREKIKKNPESMLDGTEKSRIEEEIALYIETTLLGMNISSLVTCDLKPTQTRDERSLDDVQLGPCRAYFDRLAMLRIAAEHAAAVNEQKLDAEIRNNEHQRQSTKRMREQQDASDKNAHQSQMDGIQSTEATRVYEQDRELARGQERAKQELKAIELEGEHALKAKESAHRVRLRQLEADEQRCLDEQLVELTRVRSAYCKSLDEGYQLELRRLGEKTELLRKTEEQKSIPAEVEKTIRTLELELNEREVAFGNDLELKKLKALAEIFQPLAQAVAQGQCKVDHLTMFTDGSGQSGAEASGIINPALRVAQIMSAARELMAMFESR